MRRKEYVAFLENQLDSACKALYAVEHTIKCLNRNGKFYEHGNGGSSQVGDDIMFIEERLANIMNIYFGEEYE
jgi:hypothetical protein